jgi:mannitol 2-dehydrogenase
MILPCIGRSKAHAARRTSVGERGRAARRLLEVLASVRISSQTVRSLPSEVKRPAYDRGALVEGIVHFGVGNFHRAHQALYVDEAMEAAGVPEWGVCGVGLLPEDRTLGTALAAQDGLYTLLERSTEYASVRVIGALKRCLFAPTEPQAVFEAIAAPETRIVSLTVTEAGYRARGANGLDFAHPDVVHDFRRRWRPKTIYGYLAEGLDRRRLRGLGPVTVASCDSVPDNGQVIRRALLDFASARSGELGRWIEECVGFPSSLGDRVALPASPADREFLRGRHGIVDACPVTAEPFRQWVLEDAFVAGRPAFERAGVLLTNDVRPYQEAKLRLHGAAQSALGYLGYLAGHRFLHEVADEAEFTVYLDGLMGEEILPLLAPLPGLDLERYELTLRRRFANRAVVSPLLRLCADGSAKVPRFVLPSIRDALARNGPIEKLCLCVAAWLRFLEGEDERGNPIPILDAGVGPLLEAIRRHRPDPRPALETAEIFAELGRVARFVEEVSRLSTTLHEQGTRAALSRWRASAAGSPRS